MTDRFSRYLGIFDQHEVFKKNLMIFTHLEFDHLGLIFDTHRETLRKVTFENPYRTIGL